MYLGRPTSTGRQLKKSPCIITIISQVVVATKEAEVYQLTLLTFKHRLILSCPARWLLFSSMINGHASDLTIKISSCLWSDDYDQHLIVSTSDQFSAVPFPVCQLASMLSVGRTVFRWTSLWLYITLEKQLGWQPHITRTWKVTSKSMWVGESRLLLHLLPHLPLLHHS